MLKKFIIFFLLTANYFLLTVNSHALELQSPRFKLDVEKLDIDVKPDRPTAYTIRSLYGEKALEGFKSGGVVIISRGLDGAFHFSLSQSLINSPREADLTVSTFGNLDYSISLIQEYPLKNFSGETIDLDFSLDNTHFRPIPNQNTGEFPATILTNNSEGQIKITFKLNPSPDQPEGTYETVLDFLAIPGY